MYEIKWSDEFTESMKKLKKKDKILFERIQKDSNILEIYWQVIQEFILGLLYWFLKLKKIL